MKIILKENVEKLGKSGEVKEVKDGYARNYLIPRGLALIASKKNLKFYEEQKELNSRRQEKQKQAARGLAEKLSNASCTIAADVGPDEKLYGSVTSADIAEAFAKEGVSLDKRQIILEGPIKKTGVFKIPVHLHPEVKTEVKVWVVKK